MTSFAVTSPFFITPDWQVPTGVHALMSTRLGGISPAPYNSMNVGSTSGDKVENVTQNRKLLAQWINQQGLEHAQAPYFKQVHGIHALNLDDENIRSLLAQGQEPEADACYTTTKGVVCAVRVADCMPVFIAVPGGVAAIHAGWRGLAQGIIQNTLKQLLHACQQDVKNAVVWLGPCIGKEKFEVGPDVKKAFEQRHADNTQAFKPIPGQANKWLGNLPWLAQTELHRNGVKQIYTDGRCTVTEEKLFFSYRRDQKKLGGTGHMIACIWMQTS